MRLSIPWAAWFPALAERNVRLYLWGQTVSIMGTWVLDITLNLLVWELTRSPALVGVLNFVLYAPGLVVTPLFSQRLTAANARRWTMRVLGASLALALALALLMGMGRLGIAPILALGVVRGVLNAMEVPARQMLLATSMARPEQIGGAVALNTTVFQVARMSGPALAAVLFTTAGPLWGFLFTAGGLVVMMACIRGLHPAGGAEAAAPGARHGLGGAIDFVRTDRFGRLFLPVVTCLAFFASGYQTLVPVLGDAFGGAARWTSIFFGAAGGGSLVAAVLLSSRLEGWLLRRLPAPLPWIAGLALLGLGTSRTSWLTLPCFFAVGFTLTVLSTGTTAMLHKRVPPQARNGLIALMLVAFNGMIPLAQLLAGVVAQRLGVHASFQAMGVLLLACLVLLYVPRWHAAGRLEFDAERI